MIELKKKRKFSFNFGINQIGCLHIKKSYNNLFLTLTDLKGYVVCCKTFGTLYQNEPPKKQRKGPLAMGLMFNSILPFFAIYNLKFVVIFCRIRITSQIHHLVKLLKAEKIIIKRISVIRRLSYNQGMRGRRVRKI